MRKTKIICTLGPSTDKEGVLETLMKRSQLFPYKNVRLYLFAKNGFTKGCIEKADRLGNVALVTYSDILNY